MPILMTLTLFASRSQQSILNQSNQTNVFASSVGSNDNKHGTVFFRGFVTQSRLLGRSHSLRDHMWLALISFKSSSSPPSVWLSKSKCIPHRTDGVLCKWLWRFSILDSHMLLFFKAWNSVKKNVACEVNLCMRCMQRVGFLTGSC